MGVDVSLHLFNLEIYSTLVLPAYVALRDRGDATQIVRLLDELLPDVKIRRSELGLFPLPREAFEEYRDIVARKTFYSSIGREGSANERTSDEDLKMFVQQSVAPLLVQLLCVPRTPGFRPEHDMSDSALMSYLYDRSRWVEDYFTFAKAPTGVQLEIAIGDWGQLFSDDEVQQFDSELASIPEPIGDENLIEKFRNLRAIIQAAAQRPSLGIMVGGA